MSLFLSTYVNKIDKKSRVSVPASFRASLSDQKFQGIVVFPSTKFAALEGFSMARMEELSQRLDNFDLFSDTQDDLAASIFSNAVPLSFDENGRVMLPQALADHAGITEQALFVGMGVKFQIWDLNAFEKRRTDAMNNVRDNKLTVPKGSAS
jgi:MraZ protein